MALCWWKPPLHACCHNNTACLPNVVARLHFSFNISASSPEDVNPSSATPSKGYRYHVQNYRQQARSNKAPGERELLGASKHARGVQHLRSLSAVTSPKPSVPFFVLCSESIPCSLQSREHLLAPPGFALSLSLAVSPFIHIAKSCSLSLCLFLSLCLCLRLSLSVSRAVSLSLSRSLTHSLTHSCSFSHWHCCSRLFHISVSRPPNSLHSRMTLRTRSAHWTRRHPKILNVKI